MTSVIPKDIIVCRAHYIAEPTLEVLYPATSIR